MNFLPVLEQFTPAMWGYTPGPPPGTQQIAVASSRQK